MVIFICQISFGQETSNKTEKLNSQFKLTYNILSIEGSYEIPLNEKFLLEGGIGVGAGSYIRRGILLNNKAFSSSLSFKSFPPLRFRSRLKYIYNREKRAKKKKNNNISLNSGNYIAFQSLLTLKQNNVTDLDEKEIANNVLLTEVQWGLQRHLGGKWLFNFNLGIGYANDFNSKLGIVYPSIGVEFSYVLF